ncbi:hypothetical protein V1292_004077 [Bradyrhizobium sp. AZCC 1719]|uniref:hypothetical protein n=1 Tax=Bradyrhizobium sp. AZCC 1719 TaxID=3117028 RepID=UPI002FF310AE
MGQYVFLLTLLAEFRRALAAARRYENLRYGCAYHDALAPAEIPRRIFEEFYASKLDSDDAAIAPGQNTAWSGLQTICHQYGHDLPESPENRCHVRQIWVRPGNPG